jgi:hypothetical protein
LSIVIFTLSLFLSSRSGRSLKQQRSKRKTMRRVFADGKPCLARWADQM